SLRPKGVVAPVLESAEEEDLDAELSAFVMNGEDVGLLDRPGRGIALRLDQGQGRETVPDEGSAVEIEVFGGLVHVGLQVAADRIGVNRPELAGVPDSCGLAFEEDFARGRAGPTLHLVLQARPCAGGVETVGPVAQQEGLLQAGNSAADGDGRSEGAEVMA